MIELGPIGAPNFKLGFNGLIQKTTVQDGQKLK